MQARRPADVIRADLDRLEVRRLELRRELAEVLQITAPGRSATRWRGAALADLRADYEGTTLKLREIAERHLTSPGNICNLAALHHWERRAFYAQSRRGDAIPAAATVSP
jgi:hypothetical protein